MSPAYRQLWNEDVQKRIDRDIEKNRKADARVNLEGVPAGTEVKVEQLSHRFIFGAHIFNYNQLGTAERNERYKALFGTLFNSATIAFYWKKFEMEEGKPRFQGEYRDTEEYWNTVSDPKHEPHWRRPASDPVVEFCETKGVRLHGHPLVWGNNRWHYPEWLLAKLPAQFRDRLGLDKLCENHWPKIFDEFTPEQLEKLFPEFMDELNAQVAKRILQIGNRYKGRIHSWDVVNESAVDCKYDRMIPEAGLCRSMYGLMPGDYTYRSFKIADGVFPKSVKLNINDYMLTEDYAAQTTDLLERGCKIDIVGAQMHLFNPQICQDIADGKPLEELIADKVTPDRIWETMERLSRNDRPLHLSEITITAPGNDERGQAIQAEIARNLYRLWFSVEKMMGITWWNVVDDCGAPGEPSVSGLFSRDMEPKAAYHALNQLIHDEWKTRLTAKAGRDGAVEFRGFRGGYRLSWQDAAGRECTREFELD